MSSDNGIFVLKCKAHDDQVEFRVAHLWAIENIYTGPGGAINPSVLRRAFGRSEVHASSDLAMERANAMLQAVKRSGQQVEYGILQIDLGMPFPARIGREARYSPVEQPPISEVLELVSQV